MEETSSDEESLNLEIEEQDSGELVLYLWPRVSQIHHNFENIGDRKDRVSDFSKDIYEKDICFLNNANQIHTRQFIQPILVMLL